MLYLNAFQMPYLDSLEGKYIYEKLGAFFSHLVNRNSFRKQAFVTGPLFSHHFFALVKQVLSNIDDITAVQQIINQSQMNHEGSVNFASKDLNGYLTPVLSFIHGMQSSGVSDLFVKQLQELSPLQLSEMIQGKTVSIPLVLDSLQIEDSHATSVFAEHVAWIQQKILEADQKWLRQFIIAFTGQNSLSTHAQLKITPIALERGSTFAMNPYLRVLEIPNIAMNKEEFLTAFEQIIVTSPDFLRKTGSSD